MNVIPIKAVAELPRDTSVEWSNDLGHPPFLMWIDLTELVIDRRYQREVSTGVSRRRIARILKNFKWRRFQPPTVATTAEGYAVLDGQHRVAAARLHPQIKKIPCYWVGNLSLEDQADAFVHVNKERGPVSAVAVYHAQVAAGDLEALQVRAVLTAVGVSIALHPIPGGLPPGQTYAVGRIRGCIKRYGQQVTRTALRVLVKAAGGNKDELRGVLIGGLAAFIFRYQGEDLYSNGLLRDVLIDHTAKEWTRLAEDHRAAMNVSGYKAESAMRDVILEAYRARHHGDFGAEI